MKTATIVVLDEVNCKLHGLDLDTRQKLVNKFKFMVPYARHLPAVKLGRWDGKVAFVQLGGSTYINLLDEILPMLAAEGYDVELDDRRDYSSVFEFPEVNKDSFSHVQWQEGHRLEGEPIVLNDHQVEAINTFLKNPQCLQEIATSAGKTVITAALSRLVEPYGRSIIIVPNKSLVTQTEEDYINMGLDVGVYYGGRKEWAKTHTICTWQSLNSLFKQSKDGSVDLTFDDFVEGVQTVIIDECFAGDTLILTPTGNVPIKDLVPGDEVVNYCEGSQTFKVDTVVTVHENLPGSTDMLRLTFSGGTSVDVTANHKFLTSAGWVRADGLTPLMDLVTASKTATWLKSRTVINKPAVTYNLHIKNDHNYVANSNVVSNCHSAKADALKLMLGGPMAHIPIRWGLTGTIPKEQIDALTLKCSIGTVVGHVTAAELQKKGILANCHIHIKQLQDNRQFGDYQSELKYLLSNGDRLDLLAEMIMKYSSSGNTLVLVDRVSAANDLAIRLGSGENVSVVTGKVKEAKRREEYSDVQTSEGKIIIATYGVAAVGLNIPRIFNLVLIEPGKSFVRVIQSIGRSLRIAKDKDYADVYDITSNCKFVKRHLQQRKQFYAEAEYNFDVEKIRVE